MSAPAITVDPTLDGSVHSLLRVAWPLMISMLGHTLMGLVDTLMVSGLGQTAVAAVGLAHVASLVPLCAGMGFLNGVRVGVAQAVGAGEPAVAHAFVRLGARAALVIAAVALASTPLSTEIMTVLGADHVGEGGLGLEYASEWYVVRLFGFPMQFVAIALLAGFDGHGQTRRSMVVNVLANVVNIAGCWALVPVLGVVGSAWATVLANVAQLALALWMRAQDRGERPQAPADTAAIRRRLLTLGAPTGLQWTLEVLSWTILSSFVARFGDAQLAAHSIAARICSVSFLPGHAIGDATSILVGQAVGARAPAAARRAYRSGAMAVIVAMGSMGVLFGLIPDVFLGPFHPTESTRLIGQDLLLMAAVYQLVDGTVMVTQGALNGAGDTRFTMATGIGLTWVYWMPLSWFYVIHQRHGAVGAWAVFGAYFVAVALVTGLRWRSRGVLERACAERAPQPAS